MWTTSVVVAPSAAVGLPAPLKGSISDTVRDAAALGYDAVQFAVNRPSEFDLRQALRALEDHHLGVTSIATGEAYSVDGLGLGHGDEARRVAAVERVAENIRLAGELGGANVVIGLIRGRFSDAASPARFMANYRHSIESCLTAAERAGITLVHEAIGRTDSDVLRSIDENLTFLDEFSSPHLRLHVDAHHMGLEEDDWPAAVRRARAQLVQVDISDVERRVPDGSGFDFPRLVALLQEIDFGAYLVFEYNSVGRGIEEAAAGLTYIRSLV